MDICPIPPCRRLWNICGLIPEENLLARNMSGASGIQLAIAILDNRDNTTYAGPLAITRRAWQSIRSGSRRDLRCNALRGSAAFETGLTPAKLADQVEMLTFGAATSPGLG